LKRVNQLKQSICRSVGHRNSFGQKSLPVADFIGYY
jgi:hypothetical protein